ncbi:uncharacterized protein LAESUDRAFT_734581 [Laetiporus sulphureus 93-53]|uniref:Histone chaperone domain-containing protein n=1 Tax=Laetiporus sulphureus 93-53 TaxID=1314785 RepID=A0A165GU67_9APHY|nr:uncharacterized protein LAESUDRAFT_734581 [Laetiporus sulphureus 93-53]KZT10817.1 hypothetical protein LAESUDRAFT_734581 [Laetiporus sulphureus 93-53]
MSTEATSSSGSATAQKVSAQSANGTIADKGKGKFVHEDPVDDDDEDDDEEEEEDDDDDMEEDDLGEIDPSAIIGSRRTRGVRVDYTSQAALAKAGLKPEGADDDEGEDSFVAKDEDMQDD